MKILVDNKEYTISAETLADLPEAGLREWDNYKYSDFIKKIEADNGIKGNRKGRAAAGRAVVDAVVRGSGSVGNTPFPAGTDEISEFWGSISKVED